MTPFQALEMLDRLVASAQLTREVHKQFDLAVLTLKRAITPPPPDELSEAKEPISDDSD